MSRFAAYGVVVTGAAQGIGLGIVTRFLDEGAGVVAFDRNADRLAEAVAGLGAGPRCVAFAGDVAMRDDCRRAVERCVAEFGRIDVMCAHAGIADPLGLLEMTDEHWRRHMAINVDGTMHCVVEAARAMKENGGSVICTSSVNAWFVEETHAVYNVTKAAVWALVRSAAIDLARHKIRVNGVAPGVADTPLAALVTRDPVLGPEYLKTIPLGRFAEPADIAAAVAFLASRDAAYITGQTIVLDGGQTLGIPGSLG